MAQAMVYLVDSVPQHLGDTPGVSPQHPDGPSSLRVG